MSGRRSEIARKRRRRERRNFKSGVQEMARQTADHGDTTAQPKFDHPMYTPCLDCNLENRLRTTDLRPAPIGATPLKPTRLSSWRPTASIGCETCDGTGRVPLEEYDQIDPYDTSRTESRENAEAVKLWRQRTSSSLVTAPLPVSG